MKIKVAFITCAVVFLAFVLESCFGEKSDVLSGEFSVGENKKVRFSRGNLQYKVDTKTYKFANNQWEVLDMSKNSQKESISGFCDRFCWGSGDNPFFQPDTFVDWGNKIIEKGDIIGLWRTLSADEWNYLINKRLNCRQLVAFGVVNNVGGMILLPDNWVLQNDLELFTISSDSMCIMPNMIVLRNDDTTDYVKKNIFSIEKWKSFEDAGCVFMPFNQLSFGDEVGEYWTTTDEYLSFDKRCIWPKRGCITNALKMSVRLVKDVEK